MVTFSKLKTWALFNSVAFCGVIVDVLEGGSNKFHIWSVKCVHFLGSLQEKRENKNLVRKDQLILDTHINWPTCTCDENVIK